VARLVNRIEIYLGQRYDGECVPGGVDNVVKRLDGLENLLEVPFHVRVHQIAWLARDVCSNVLLLQGSDALLKAGGIRRHDVNSGSFGKGLVGNSVADTRRAADDEDGGILDRRYQGGG
jgi:hypothetical protein